MDALLSDICIGTSAAPTYFPAHYFETKDPSGKVREFNLIDGGVAANNPVCPSFIFSSLTCITRNILMNPIINFLLNFQTLVAVSEVSKEITRKNPDFFPTAPMDYGRFLVLSLGTGTAKSEEKYDADEAAKWGILGWLTSDNSTPLVDVFTEASGDMVDLHVSTVFQALHSEENYLRIQVYITLMWLFKISNYILPRSN
jgi:hypothetical protein